MSHTSSNEKKHIVHKDGNALHEVNSRAIDPHLHIEDIVPQPAWYAAWEHRRPQWVQECVGEFFGVFFYCFCGMGATASLIIGQATDQPFLGSLLQVGFAYAMGITFALTVCAMSSGGHFNPAITIAFAIYRDFPWRKVPYYIASQVFGGYVATLIVYGQYKVYIDKISEVLIATGHEAQIFSAQGPAGIFAIYPNPGIPLKWVFMNEFFADFFVGLVIWGIIDPSNIFVTPGSVPILVGLAYGTAVWGYVPATIATNPARDLGPRLAAITIWGTKAWGGKYALIGCLTSLVATLFAATIYNLFMLDTSRVVTSGFREVMANTDRHRDHQAYKYNVRSEHMRTRARGMSDA